MKKIAICDDEPAVRKQMEAYFKELESVFCISYFESGETLLESDVLYDVIFLDIDMKGIRDMILPEKSEFGIKRQRSFM